MTGTQTAIGVAVRVDYPAEILSVVSIEGAAFNSNLPVQNGPPVDTGTQILNLNAQAIPPLLGTGLSPGQSFLLGTITFQKGPGVGTFFLPSFVLFAGDIFDASFNPVVPVVFNFATLTSQCDSELGCLTLAPDLEDVTVGGLGNACDPFGQNCFGSVADPYLLGKFEVTNGQYTDFLNAVATTDTNALYSIGMSSGTIHGGIERSGSSGSFSYSAIAGREDWPVIFVSFWDATRFANWLHNGQPTGAQDNTTTEDGAYTLTPAGITNNTVTRNAGAQVFVTSEDEWFKGAYYDPSAMTYFDYPAGSDTQTTCTLPGATPNTANCLAVMADLASAGSYTGSASPNGTFDQGGNVWEWNETIVSTTNRGFRGGNFSNGPDRLGAFQRFDAVPSSEFPGVGFRVAGLARTCGNGFVETGEDCDDANTSDGDCCSATCQFETTGSSCDDADACTNLDTCDGSGSCTSGAPLVCNDSEICTDDTCDSGSGCVFANNVAPCDDSDVCTTGDICAGGTCNGGPPLGCSDSNACTDDSCNPASGCFFPNNVASCDDGAFCTGADTCSGGSCSVHVGDPCVGPDGDSNCSESCDEGADSCTAADPDGSLCTDGDVCSTVDACSAGACAGGSPVDCDDGDPCTAESCDAITGCAHDPIPACVAPVPSVGLPGRMAILLAMLTVGTVFLGSRTRPGRAGLRRLKG